MASTVSTHGVNGRIWVVFKEGRAFKIVPMGEKIIAWDVKSELRTKTKEKLRKYGKVYALYASDGRVTIPWREMTEEQKAIFNSLRGTRKKN